MVAPEKFVPECFSDVVFFPKQQETIVNFSLFQQCFVKSSEIFTTSNLTNGILLPLDGYQIVDSQKRPKSHERQIGDVVSVHRWFLVGGVLSLSGPEDLEKAFLVVCFMFFVLPICYYR